jgi:hypothetical protein
MIKDVFMKPFVGAPDEAGMTAIAGLTVGFCFLLAAIAFDSITIAYSSLPVFTWALLGPAVRTCTYAANSVVKQIGERAAKILEEDSRQTTKSLPP